jgi:hypothetical protein
VDENRHQEGYIICRIGGIAIKKLGSAVTLIINELYPQEMKHLTKNTEVVKKNGNWKRRIASFLGDSSNGTIALYNLRF